MVSDLPPSAAQARQLAATLGEATVEVLYARAREWLPAACGCPPLTTRAGHGRATYCRHDDRGFCITYGALMIVEKCDPVTAPGWLTTREVMERGYFDGDLRPVHLLAHTVCHEFAHFLQAVRGWRARGSVHNGGFYRLLDGLHRDGAANRVHAFLAARHGSIAAPARAVQTDRIVHESIRCGDLVGFPLRNGRTVTGRVQRINRRTVTVLPDRPDRPGQYYRVPPSLLRRLDDP